MSKRFGSFALLSLFLWLAAFTSCARKPEQPISPPQPIRVLYLTIWSDGLNKAFHAECAAWAKETGTPVEVVDIPLKDLSHTVATYVASGRGADLAVFPAHLTILNEAKLADVSAIVKAAEAEIGPTYPVARAMNTVGTRWVGVPLFAWSHIWVYRGDLLRSKGLQPAATWDDASALARALTDRKKGVYGLGIGLGKDDDVAMFFQALLWASGGSVFAEDGRTVRVDSKETRSAVKRLIDLYRAGAIPPGALGWDGASNNQNFLAGAIAITANSPTIYYAARHQNQQLAANIEHSVYPAGPAGRFSYATEFSLAFLKDSPRQKDAAALVRYLLRKDNYNALISAAEGSVNPLYTGIDAMTLWHNDPKLKPSLDSLAIEKPLGWPGPVTPVAAEVYERRIVTDIFARVINDGLSVDAAVKEADARVREVVERQGGGH
jgi:multiple sugar transport system substrate-binding protein